MNMPKDIALSYINALEDNKRLS